MIIIMLKLIVLILMFCGSMSIFGAIGYVVCYYIEECQFLKNGEGTIQRFRHSTIQILKIV